MACFYTTNLSAGRLAIFCYLNAHFINSTFQLSLRCFLNPDHLLIRRFVIPLSFRPVRPNDLRSL
nr:MAG TPA: hypothetical protein [Caudoviricetes sp.]